jgi:hypothetical protein
MSENINNLNWLSNVDSIPQICSNAYEFSTKVLLESRERGDKNRDTIKSGSQVCGYVVMMISPHSLWRLNHEYNQRLSRARNYVALLERLVIARNIDEQPQLMAALGYIRDQLDLIYDEHRDWRYRYFYDSPENKRMVHEEHGVGRAMTQFARMRVEHERNLNGLCTALADYPPPERYITAVPHGDLWQMMLDSLEDLLGFGDFIRELDTV